MRLEKLAASPTLRRCWQLLKVAASVVSKLTIFAIIVADAILAVATIAYAIAEDKVWLFVFWMPFAFVAVQFFIIFEKRRSNQQTRDNATSAKMVLSALVGSAIGALLWPAFDAAQGITIGIAFGSVLGLIVELTFELIIFTQPG